MGTIQSFGLPRPVIGALATAGAAVPVWVAGATTSGGDSRAAASQRDTRVQQLRIGTGAAMLGATVLAAVKPGPASFGAAIALGAAHVGAWVAPAFVGGSSASREPRESAPSSDAPPPAPSGASPAEPQDVMPDRTDDGAEPDVAGTGDDTVTGTDTDSKTDAPTDRGDVFRGTGAWIDLYDYHLLDDPAAAVKKLKDHGVQTVYIETSKFDRDYAIYEPDKIDALLKEAHANDIKVVAWYFPGLDDVDLDLERSLKAINYESPSGEKFDGFGLDIEAQNVANIDVRVDRLVDLSQGIRDGAGEDYSLAAITPPPAKNTNPGGAWAKFPWQELAHEYDAWMPMSFFTQWRPPGASDAGAVKSGFLADINEIREETKGAPQLPIHVIGEVAQTANGADLDGFVQAVRAGGAEGASVYDMATSRDEEWRTIDALSFLNE